MKVDLHRLLAHTIQHYTPAVPCNNVAPSMFYSHYAVSMNCLCIISNKIQLNRVKVLLYVLFTANFYMYVSLSGVTRTASTVKLQSFVHSIQLHHNGVTCKSQAKLMQSSVDLELQAGQNWT